MPRVAPAREPNWLRPCGPLTSRRPAGPNTHSILIHVKATIEIGHRPQVFWLAALAMCEEHKDYYARENAFRANFRLFQDMVDAHNAGSTQALHYGAIAAVGGLSPAVQQSIAEELGAEVARPANCWGSMDDIFSPVDPGFSFHVNPDMDGSLYAAWLTSGGNLLSVRLQGQWVWVTVEGRRHGIPWRFLDNCGLCEADLLVVGHDSQSNAQPWCDGRGYPLWTPSGEVRQFAEGPAELSSPLEDYPSWGDFNQQARWAADRVYAWAQLGGLIRACASMLTVGSEAIEMHQENTWPYRTRPVLRLPEQAETHAGTQPIQAKIRE